MQGAGLGLTLVSRLSRLMGGSARAFYEEQGFDGYLGKPIREADLARVLESNLSL